MKRRKHQTPQSPLRVRITHEEIMRDLLFPASPTEGRQALRRRTARG